LLKAAIAKIRWSPIGGTLDALSPVALRDTEVTERFNSESDQVASGNPKQYTLVHPHDNVDQIQLSTKDAAKNAALQEAGIYMQTSLGTIKYIISGMNNLPGRKAMMLFSDGIAIGNDSAKSRASSIFDYLQDVTDVANRSSVVIYTFDTRGLQSMAITASDSTYEVIDGHREQKINQRSRDFNDSQDGLVYFAERTGGKALLNSGDLNGGIQRALDEQAGYYLLGYVPDAASFDPAKRKFNKFEIKVKRPGVKVSYRSGFFSTDPGNAVKPVLNAERQINDSLMSPFVKSDIALNMNALYATDPVDGNYLRSFLHIDAKGLTFSDTADGWKTASFDVAAVAFGDNGLPVDHSESKYTIKTKGATYDTMLEKGFVYTLIVPIKKPGVYQYRVALRDSDSGKIGSAAQIVEIPDVSKQRLTMSTIAVEDVSMVVWQNIAQGKVGNGPNQVHVASTLLYDTVLKQFTAGTVLRYGFEVYNAKRDNSQTVRLETQARILQNDKAVIEGAVNKFESAAPKTQVSGAILLKDTLQPGDYVVQITTRDTLTKQVSSQVFPFEIIKP
jgi:VWFA-related protein